ncbi:hypothetical protein PFICI_06355 [Pestalotiopsis fici W106-1]|uniref:Fe2OG dioxygenase domain-containing protein n=1 Tax=Pestalotiopsis fici (strain W106-1 / CGMCC3.15140) TaxID=1229662 RepID=W3X5G0_PESFW|nr:uncharacterized protein PFICI_06355 [Pestalotiopsis fici W106-1]ETS81353.1 hypothetical protein PFICI_06355 [Pestalotiopsis fici W106-1]
MTPFTLDLSDFQSNSPEFARKALEGFRRDGFIKLVGHGISESEINQLLAWNKAFFALPLEEKLAVSNVAGPEPQRGYSAVGVEKTATLNINGAVNLEMASHEGREDFKETFDMGGPNDTDFPNQWPAETSIPGLRSWLEQYWFKSHKVAMRVLNALELALGVPQDSFVSRCDGCKSEMRLIHYPNVSAEKLQSNNTMRIWPHTDASAITLLVQDSSGGLEVENQSSPGSFESVSLVNKTELIVNGGETLERWTNGLLKPVLHQVNVPPGPKCSESGTIPSRLSVAFFVNANADASMGPYDKFVSANEPSKFPDMLSREYHRLRNAVVY